MKNYNEVLSFIEKLLPIDTYYSGWSKNIRKNIEYMVGQVKSDEDIVFGFPYYQCGADINGCLLITDKRIMYGSGIKSLMWTPHFKSVDLKDFNDISLNYQRKVSVGFFSTINNQSQVIIDTIREKIIVTFYHQKGSIKDPVQVLQEASLDTLLFEIKEKLNNKAQKVEVIGGTSSAADEIRKYKALLDDGIITQEEFDAKKKELLGL